MLVELRVAELRYRAVWEVLADYQLLTNLLAW
jgi:hypothetical protein